MVIDIATINGKDSRPGCVVGTVVSTRERASSNQRVPTAREKPRRSDHSIRQGEPIGDDTMNRLLKARPVKKCVIGQSPQ